MALAAAVSQQRWTHPQYSLAAVRGTSAAAVKGAAPELPEFVRKAGGAQRRRSAIHLPICPWVSFSILIFAALVVGVRLVETALPHSGGEARFNFVLQSLKGSREGQGMVERMSQNQRLQLISQVRYVLDIIKTHGKRNGAAADARHLAESIVLESIKANYDPLFVAAVIKSESTFNRQAVSKVGAKGLMQIMPDTGKYISTRNSFPWRGAQKLSDASYNIQLGIAYLKQLDNFFRGNREHVLMAYNWGPGNVVNALKNKGEIPESTVKYARNIISTHRRWSTDYKSRAQQFRYAGLDNLA